MSDRSYRVLRLVVGAFSVAASGCASPTRTTPQPSESDSAAIAADVTFLASPALAGRLIGTPGNDSAAAYIARRSKSLGVGALSADYRQPFIAHPPVPEGPRPSIATQNVFAVV